MRRLCYTTRYSVDGSWYSSHIYANSLREARKLARQRGIGEVVQGVCESETVQPEDLTGKAHLACFLGYIALKAGTMTLEDILGDRGVLHEAIHLLCGDPSAHPQEVENGLARLRGAVPGYDPV